MTSQIERILKATESHDIFHGDGEMPYLMQNFDWSKNSIGQPETWPQSLRTLVEVMLGSNQAMFIAWGPERVMLYNNAYSKLLGQKHPEALGRSFDQIWHEIWSDIEPIMTRAYGGESTHMDDIALILNRHGFDEEAHFSFSYTPVRDETGTVAGMFCACTEITNKVKAEAERDAILDSIADGFFALDSQWRFNYVNSVAEKLLGMSQEELMGKNHWDIFPETRSTHVEQEYQRAMSKRTPVTLENFYEPWQRWYEIRAYPAMNGGITVYFQESTQRKKAEQALRQQEERQRFLIDLNIATQSLTDPTEITTVTAQKLGEYLNCDRCAYAEVDADEDHFDLIGNYTRGVQSIVGRYAMSSFGQEVLRLQRAGKAYIVNDVDNDPQVTPEDLAAYRQTQICAVICVPLRKQGRFVAAMAVHQATPRIWTPEEVELVRFVVGLCWESIERARVVRILKESEERWRTLTEAMPQLVWIDRASDGSCEYLSKQWEEYTGQPVDQLLGYEWLKLLHPDDTERTKKAWNESVAGRADYDIEYRIRRSDGVYNWFKVRGVPVRDEAGKIQVWYGTCTNIQEMVDARQKAEAANSSKSDFLANMSHEIRTPMNAVVGLSNILSISTPLTDRQKECISTLKSSADHLLELINDLLDFEKIEDGSVQLESVDFDFPVLLGKIVNMMGMKIEEKGIAFNIDYDPSLPQYFIGDPLRIQQILNNLVSNAIKFTEHGHVTIEITGAYKPGHSIADVKIRVIDTGIGIPKNKLDTIFEKFTQADSSTTRNYGGSGLGLSICTSLVGLMEGDISVTSESGAGSVFTVNLPLKVSKKQFPAKKSDVIFTKPAVDIPLKNSPCVLLVEDYQANILVATTMIENFGYSCEIAHDGYEAIEKFKTSTCSVIFMDVQMPGIDGFETTQRIRQIEKQNGLLRTPIIAMTAHAMDGDKEKCLSAGMDDYIPKPFNPEILREKLLRFIKEKA